MINISKITQNNISKVKNSKNSKKAEGDNFADFIVSDVAKEEKTDIVTNVNNFSFNNFHFNEEINKSKALKTSNEILDELEIIKMDFLLGEKNLAKLEILNSKIENMQTVFDPKIRNLIEELKTLIIVEIEKIKKIK